MQLFYNPYINETSKEVIFNKEESRHISKVLRKNEGDNLHSTNGIGFIFELKITFSNSKQCVASVLKVKKQSPLPYHLHLVVAPTKQNERYEWFLEKATEIGVSEITPIICRQSERKVINKERYEKKIQSAMKQSLRAYLPVLHPAISFKEFVNTQASNNNLKLIAHCESSSKQSLKNILKPKESVMILIGPEGDFSTQEIEMAIEADFFPVSLGAGRLRTETAAIIACHCVAFVNE